MLFFIKLKLKNDLVKIALKKFPPLEIKFYILLTFYTRDPVRGVQSQQK